MFFGGAARPNFFGGGGNAVTTFDCGSSYFVSSFVSSSPKSSKGSTFSSSTYSFSSSTYANYPISSSFLLAARVCYSSSLESSNFFCSFSTTGLGLSLSSFS